jgi:hypothetical protein
MIILLALLPPRSSHLLQSLNIGFFDPVEKAMTEQLEFLFRTGITRMQKMEWLENYIKTLAIPMNPQNIFGGWRGTGLFLLNHHRILRPLSEAVRISPLTQPQTTATPFDGSLMMNSPPESSLRIAINHDII